LPPLPAQEQASFYPSQQAPACPHHLSQHQSQVPFVKGKQGEGLPPPLPGPSEDAYGTRGLMPERIIALLSPSPPSSFSLSSALSAPIRSQAVLGAPRLPPCCWHHGGVASGDTPGLPPSCLPWEPGRDAYPRARSHWTVSTFLSLQRLPDYRELPSAKPSASGVGWGDQSHDIWVTC